MNCSQMKISIRVALFTLSAFCSWTAGYAAESSGYLRSGLGVSEGGTKQECFTAEGALAKHRLGNECENYLELGFTQKFPGKPGEFNFVARVLMAFQSEGDRDWESTQTNVKYDDTNKSVSSTQDSVVAFREAYVSASKDFTNEQVYWVGKRFYRRRDIHMLDYYLLSNTGSGFGLENFKTGSLTWHFAILRNIPKSEGPSQNNFDIRFSGFEIPVLGSLETTFVYGSTTEIDAYTAEKKWTAVSGASVSLLFDQSLKSGFNLFAVQYGQGIFGAVGPWETSALNDFGAWGSQNISKASKDVKKARESSSTLRLAEQWVYKFSPSFSHSLVLLYQDVNFGKYSHVIGQPKRKNLTETTLGSRPIWHLSSDFSMQFEYGFTNVKNAIPNLNNTKYTDSQLQKFTIAPTLTKDSQYFSRPQLRLFATYATWNEASKGKTASITYGSKTEGWSSGAQIEVWW